MSEPIDPGIKVLDEAARILRERGWTQGRMVAPTGEVCLLGAVCLATMGVPVAPPPGQASIGWDFAVYRLCMAIGPGSALRCDLTCWNDTDGRDLQQVLDLIERAKEGSTL